MSPTVRLVFGVHSHQPMGNFDDVFARALDHAYDPFLDALARHPSIKAVLHYSGCLCEWLETHAPAHLDRIARLARSGQVEILGGGFYEPILSLIPPTDRLGQIRLQTRYVRERFGVDVRGMWLPERVWEPTLPGVLREAGIDYTLLDDYHFLTSMDGDPVGGYYVTEDQGEPLHLFPISEKLRYLIPFRDAAETIAHLKEVASAPASRHLEPVAVIVDDGEKFGLWPGTREWVYGREGKGGWLESFLRALEENASWLKTSTFAEVRRDIEPRGRVYLPPGSYYEMGAWALPVHRGREFHDATHAARHDGAWAHQRPFFRGGFFRNFQAKYSESLLLVRRAQMLSAMLDEDETRSASDREGIPSTARRELWRATCNCSYWHGIFGGLYLPHIRRAVGEHLCRARRLADPRPERLVSRFVDADADGRLEVEIQTPRLGLLVEPARGGALSVIDLKETDFPLGLTLTRRVESYHRDVLESQPVDDSDPDHGSIHEISARATGEMKTLVVADDRPRASAVDRFLDAGAQVADLMKAGWADRGDFYDGRYAPTLLPETSTTDFAGVVMSREGKVSGRALTLIKTIRAGRPGRDLEVLYKLGDAPAGAAVPLPGVQFAVEFNLALIESRGRLVALDGPDAGRALSLSQPARTGAATAVRVEESHAGFTLTFRVTPGAAVWHYPVRTVSRSEEGYEAIYQGSALLFVWGGGGAVPGETRIEMALGGPPEPDRPPVAY